MAVINMGHGKIGPELIARAKKTPGVLHRAMKRSALKTRTMLVRKTPKDLGQAKAGWRVSPLIKGTSRSRVDVYNDAPHISILEFGARPHGVSLEGRVAIYEWVVRVIDPQASGPIRPYDRKTKTGGRKEFMSLTEGARNAAAAQIMQAIVWKIRHHGQKPTYFVRTSMDDVTYDFGKEVEKQIADYAKRKARRATKGKS